MRTAWAAAAGFVAGLLIATLATSHVWIRSARLSSELAHTQFVSEQDLLVGRSARAGDALRVVIHALNVADAEAGLGFRWLEREQGTTYWSWFSSPWSLYLLIGEIEQWGADPKAARGTRMLQARHRARAAIALESFGQPDLARQQWAIVTELDPSRSIDWQRQLAAYSSGNADLEDAYLDSRSFSELAEALAKTRRRRLKAPEPE